MTKYLTIEGLGGISATVIADSVSARGTRFTTMEFVFPRFLLPEVNTHRMLSKNAASSRAVPVADSIAACRQNPAMPIHWGANNSGMVSNSVLSEDISSIAKEYWLSAMAEATKHARVCGDKNAINGHKQWVNRLFENYTFTKQVISGTEWNNFFWLRDHPDAQPEFRELARCAKEAMDKSTPVLLNAGQWHLPYITQSGADYKVGGDVVDLETAKMISASCCAQVSYRKLDDSIEKAKKIYDMLNLGSTDVPQHASPIEHQATPMQPTDFGSNTNIPENVYTWEPGITHVRRDFSLWSGNLRGWIQARQLVPGESRW